MFVRTLSVIVLLAAACPAFGQEGTNKPNTDWPAYQEADYVIHDYKFASGESLPEVKLHYRTIGTPKQNAAGAAVNAVLLLQGNTGTGANWFRPMLADELFKPGQPLDAAKYYIIMPDALGRGGSSKPSDGLKGRFPHYRYRDMVDLTHRLVTDGLRVAHVRLLIGSSLGCMQQFLWAEWYPDLMDGTIGLSCQPVEISGRNYMLRHGAAEFIRHDPAWNNGDYDKSPTLYMYSGAGNDLTESPVRIQEEAPTMETATALYDKRLAALMKNSDAIRRITNSDHFNDNPVDRWDGRFAAHKRAPTPAVAKKCGSRAPARRSAPHSRLSLICTTSGTKAGAVATSQPLAISTRSRSILGA